MEMETLQLPLIEKLVAQKLTANFLEKHLQTQMMKGIVLLIIKLIQRKLPEKTMAVYCKESRDAEVLSILQQEILGVPNAQMSS